MDKEAVLFLFIIFFFFFLFVCFFASSCSSNGVCNSVSHWFWKGYSESYALFIGINNESWCVFLLLGKLIIGRIMFRSCKGIGEDFENSGNGVNSKGNFENVDNAIYVSTVIELPYCATDILVIICFSFWLTFTMKLALFCFLFICVFHLHLNIFQYRFMIISCELVFRESTLESEDTICVLILQGFTMFSHVNNFPF